MSKRIVTKKQIIKALMTEPLAAGVWIMTKDQADNPYQDTRIANAVDCEVCAVGAGNQDPRPLVLKWIDENVEDAS